MLRNYWFITIIMIGTLFVGGDNTSSSTYIPFGFWRSNTAFVSLGPSVISSNLTITNANYSSYENKEITINTGVTVTINTNLALTWYSLTMAGTAILTSNGCDTTTCIGINLTILTDASIASGAKIDVSKKGYLGGFQGANSSVTGRTLGNTTTGGASYYTGASYGGYGGNYSASYLPNEVYGNLYQPLEFGSGGGAAAATSSTPCTGGYDAYSNCLGYTTYSHGNDLGGNGGGALKLTVNGVLDLNGLVTANGGDGVQSSMSGYSGSYNSTYAGGGAGGSIWVAAGTISSSSTGPIFTANGGTSTWTAYNGAGGGGRIALYYGALSGTAAINSTFVKANGGDGYGTYDGGSGTVFAKLTGQVSGDLLIAGTLYSNYKNTKIGGFGTVGSVSTNVLTLSSTATPLVPASLIGKTLKPDITLAPTYTITANTATTITTSVSIDTATSAGKYFYVTNYEADFDNVDIQGTQRVNTGFLNISTRMTMGTNQVSAHDIIAPIFNATGSGTLALTNNLTSVTSSTIGAANLLTIPKWNSGTITSASSTITSTGYINATGNVSDTSSTINVGTWSNGGTLTLSSTTLTATGSMTSTLDGSITNGVTTVTGTLTDSGNLVIGGAAAVNAPTWVVGGNLTANSTAILKMQTTSVVSDFTLNNTSKVIAYTPTTTNVYPINITVTNLSVASGAKIDVDSSGYLGAFQGANSSTSGRTNGNTTTGASALYNGGSYGGYGGISSGVANDPYGSLQLPSSVGSGGGATAATSSTPCTGGYDAYSNCLGYTTYSHNNDLGGNGGGAVKITATGTFTLNGLISANGGVGVQASMSGFNSSYNTTYAGGGSGGSIWIIAGTITSSSSGPVLTSNGGATTFSTQSSGGGGGRVAIYYGNLSGTFAVNNTFVRAYGGDGASVNDGGSGTIFSKSTGQTSGDLLIAGTLYSNFRNTKIGAFGTVASAATNVLTLSSTATPLIPGVLVGKTLKPDVTLAPTYTITANTATTITTSVSIDTATSVGKYFYVTNYETDFDNVDIQGTQRISAGFFNVSTQMTMGTNQVSAHDIIAPIFNATGSGTLTLANNLTSITSSTIGTTNTITIPKWDSGTITTTSSTITSSGYINATGNVNDTSSAISVGTWSNGGTLTLTSTTLTATGNMTSTQDGSISNGVITVGGTLTDSGNLVVGGTAAVNAPTWTVGGNLTTNNTAILKMQTANVTTDFTMNNTSKVIPYDPTISNVYPITITTTNMNIGASALIDVSSKGYLGAYRGANTSTTGRTSGNTTTGGSDIYRGGSHGGLGAAYSGSPNVVYGVSTAPITVGSGGGATAATSSTPCTGGYDAYSNCLGYTTYSHGNDFGGNGGGAVKLTATGTLTMNGLINANGGDGTQSSMSGFNGSYNTTYAGGGSGGSIWITAGTITSSSAGPVLTSNGGNSSFSAQSVGGGAGRIAIYYGSLSGTFNLTTAYVRVNGGDGNGALDGAVGTTYFSP